MAGDEYGDEQREVSSEDDEGFELDPEQQEALRKTMDRVGRSLSQKIDFKLPSTAQLVPDSALKNITALSAFAETQEAIVLNVIKPFLASHGALREYFSGFSETMTKIASQFAPQQATWFKAIGPSLAKFSVDFYPPNLKDIEGLTIKQVREVVMIDGIPLYAVPRPSTAEALIRAGSASKRRDILGRRWRAISADCREVVIACTTAVIAPYRPFAIAALDALDAGHTEAAQALTGSLIDTILVTYFKADRHNFKPNRAGTRTNDAYNRLTVRKFVAFAPMWQAYQQFHAEDGDVVPTTFSRNATAHTVSRRQYNRRNAVQALMFACSLLCHLEYEASQRTA